MDEHHKIVYCTTSNKKEAEKIVHTLLGEKLIACAQILPHIESFYWWKGSIENSQEVLIIAKTIESLIGLVIERITNIHSYEVPEIIVVNIEQGLPAYLDWISESVLKSKKVD
ncbi:divalent-cation tolerance protein CutA [Chlamydiota bacterium]